MKIAVSRLIVVGKLKITPIERIPISPGIRA